MRNGRKPQGDGTSPLEPSGLLALAAQEGEGEVEAVDLTSPALGFGLCPSLEKVDFQLGESGEHLGVDVEHRAADAGFSQPVLDLGIGSKSHASPNGLVRGSCRPDNRHRRGARGPGDRIGGGKRRLTGRPYAWRAISVLCSPHWARHEAPRVTGPLATARCSGSLVAPRGGDSEIDGAAVPSSSLDLGELVLGAGEADLESFDLAEPAFSLSLGDAGEA